MTQPSRIDGLPDLPKLPDMPTFDGVVIAANGFCEGYYLCKTAEADRLACYEAGSAAAAQAAKQVPAKTDWDPRTIARFGPAVNPYIVPPAPSATSLAEAAEAQVAPDLNALIGKVSVIENDFIDRYEFDDGESAPHTPTEFESMLITDAIFGLHAEQEWAEAYHAWDVARRAGGYKPWSRVDSEVAPEAAEAGQVEVLLQELETCYRDGNPSGFDVLLSEALYERIRAALAATAASPQAPAPQAMGSLLQRLMARLADLLDDDKFNEIEGMVEAGGFTAPAPQAGAPERDFAFLRFPEVYGAQAVVGEASEDGMRTAFEAKGEFSKRLLWKRGGSVFEEDTPAENYVDVGVQRDWKLWQEAWRAALTSPAPSAAPHQGADALREAGDDYQRIGLLEWAVERWRSSVQNRPMVNTHRRTMDGCWRSVMRYAGGDPDSLVGPSHDDLLAQHQAPQQGEQHE